MRCDTPKFEEVCSVGIESNHDYCKGEGHQLMSKFNSGISLSHTLYVLTVRSGIRETSAVGGTGSTSTGILSPGAKNLIRFYIALNWGEKFYDDYDMICKETL